MLTPLFPADYNACVAAQASDIRMPPLLLSIAIVNWNTRDLLLGALDSIYRYPPSFPFEVIVVDNASADRSAEAVAGRFPQVILIANPENAGYARGNNQAIARARGAYILLLNPDVLLPPGGLERAVAFMEAHPDAGALGVRQVHPDGTVQRSVRGFPTPLAVFWELIGASRLWPQSRFFGAYRMTWFDYARVEKVDQPMGTFLLLRRQALEQVGVLDENFPIFFNEVDWCLRCRRAGWQIYFTPEVEIVHFGGASTMQVGAAMAWESRRGLLRFYAKHYRKPWYWPLRTLIALVSWPHACLQAWRRSRGMSR
ncbi:MAG: glycosyltransferase family 2 protein [Chloroherpetonaceae bacterium]|nr:glycosyltransferase family 2 protein [Chthonomonadaceae bacterium]MDW8208702.1 glycosyltransferase family 2 protein [Chloroherpetonaceae bacterium]